MKRFVWISITSLGLLAHEARAACDPQAASRARSSSSVTCTTTPSCDAVAAVASIAAGSCTSATTCSGSNATTVRASAGAPARVAVVRSGSSAGRGSSGGATTYKVSSTSPSARGTALVVAGNGVSVSSCASNATACEGARAATTHLGQGHGVGHGEGHGAGHAQGHGEGHGGGLLATTVALQHAVGSQDAAPGLDLPGLLAGSQAQGNARVVELARVSGQEPESPARVRVMEGGRGQAIVVEERLPLTYAVDWSDGEARAQLEQLLSQAREQQRGLTALDEQEVEAALEKARVAAEKARERSSEAQAEAEERMQEAAVRWREAAERREDATKRHAEARARAASDAEARDQEALEFGARAKRTARAWVTTPAAPSNGDRGLAERIEALEQLARARGLDAGDASASLEDRVAQLERAMSNGAGPRARGGAVAPRGGSVWFAPSAPAVPSVPPYPVAPVAPVEPFAPFGPSKAKEPADGPGAFRPLRAPRALFGTLEREAARGEERSRSRGAARAPRANDDARRELQSALEELRSEAESLRDQMKSLRAQIERLPRSER